MAYNLVTCDTVDQIMWTITYQQINHQKRRLLRNGFAVDQEYLTRSRTIYRRLHNNVYRDACIALKTRSKISIRGD